jgi:hypothetical protein
MIDAFGSSEAIIFGEAYGGSCQKMKATYGDQLKFIVFDVKLNDMWVDVPTMDAIATSLELEVVPWKLVTTDVAALDALRDAPSEVAVRRGKVGQREGIVLRPPFEAFRVNGNRVIAKHKAEAFSERATPQKVADPTKLEVLQQADAIADEWVTEQRLLHVLDKLPPGLGPEATKCVIDAMIEDVIREASGEIVDGKEARSAIGRRTAKLFQNSLKNALK